MMKIFVIPKKNLNNEMLFIKILDKMEKTIRKANELITRVLLRPEWSIHIGHLGSIYFNYSLVEHKGGCCYLYINDFNIDAQIIDNFIKDLDWLNLSNAKIIKMSENVQEIRQYLVNLIENDQVFVEQGHGENTVITEHTKVRQFYENSINNINGYEIIYPLKFRLKLQEANNPLLMIQRNKYTEPKLSLNFTIPILDMKYNLNLLVDGHYKHKTTNDIEKLYGYLFYYFKRKIPDKLQHHGYKLLYFHYDYEKIVNLIDGKYLIGLDDPRLLTISGLRRRGIPTRILREFCQMGNRRSNVSLYHLKHISNNYLPNLPNIKLNCISNPVKIFLSNFRVGETEFILPSSNSSNNANEEMMYFPTSESLISLSNILYIDKKWIQSLKLGSEIELKHGIKIIPETHIYDQQGELLKIKARYLGQANLSNLSITSENVEIDWISPDLELESNKSNVTHAKFNLYQKWYSGGNSLDELNYETVKGVVNISRDKLLEMKREQIFCVEGFGYFALDLDSKAKNKLDTSGKCELEFNLL